MERQRPQLPSPSEVPRPWDKWTPDQRLAFSHLEEKRPDLANRIFVSLKIIQNAPVLLPEMVQRHVRHLNHWGLLPDGYEGKQNRP